MEIVGIRFKNAGKIYYFNPCDIDPALLRQGAGVIVETGLGGMGAEYGVIALEKREKNLGDIPLPIKRVLRVATEDDLRQEDANRIREKEARKICAQKIEKHGLGMHLVEVELAFDLTKIIFFFTADGRIDFRELVKDLAATFRMRIELRQIGVRDEAKMLSGIGICGRELCCALFLNDFHPVSIKTAKDQGLSLNPSKISGICGKLMCCLKYEEATYLEFMKGMPGVGDRVRSPDGEGHVVSLNILARTAKVSLRPKGQDEPALVAYPAGELAVIQKASHAGPQCIPNAGK